MLNKIKRILTGYSMGHLLRWLNAVVLAFIFGAGFLEVTWNMAFGRMQMDLDLLLLLTLTTFATVDYLRILTQGPSLDDLDILMDDEKDV